VSWRPCSASAAASPSSKRGGTGRGDDRVLIGSSPEAAAATIPWPTSTGSSPLPGTPGTTARSPSLASIPGSTGATGEVGSRSATTASVRVGSTVTVTSAWRSSSSERAQEVNRVSADPRRPTASTCRRVVSTSSARPSSAPLARRSPPGVDTVTGAVG
jgi:hypothetical protein